MQEIRSNRAFKNMNTGFEEVALEYLTSSDCVVQQTNSETKKERKLLQILVFKVTVTHSSI